MCLRDMIKELKGTYNGPKKVKASGKAVGTKKKKTDKKSTGKASAKPAAKRKPSGPRREQPQVVSSDGLAPLKRRKPAAE